MNTFFVVVVLGVGLASLGLWVFRRPLVSEDCRTSGGLDPDLAEGLRRCTENLEEHLRPKDISEPVHAIARAMQDRPGSFKIEELCKPNSPASFTWDYRITDRATGLVADVSTGNLHHENRIKLPFCLTQDETNYLLDEGFKWINARQQRVHNYINAKRRKEWAAKYREAS